MALLQSFVGVSPVAHFNYGDDEQVVSYLVDDSVYPLPHTIAFHTRQFFTSKSSRSIHQGFNTGEYGRNTPIRNSSKILRDGLFVGQPILCHEP